MSALETGRGPAVVLIPGIPGRYEWLQPAIDALAVDHRVFSLSANDVPAGASFDVWVSAIDRLLDRAGVVSATVVGLSFGGLVAIHYASRRPTRVKALVLASPPSPRWRLDPRTALHLRWARIVMPMLAVRSVARLTPEVLHTIPGWRARTAFAVGYAWRAMRYPLSIAAMRRWVLAWLATNIEDACARVTAPTTVITGDAALDRVVPVSATMEILDLIPHARHVVFAGTGHSGAITRPDRFARLVADATQRHAHEVRRTRLASAIRSLKSA